MTAISTHETTRDPARRSQAARRRESDRRMLAAAATLIARHGVAGTTLACDRLAESRVVSSVETAVMRRS